MTEQVRPDEAARALSEIDRRHEQVIDSAAIPDWFWWAMGVLMVGFAAAVETREPIVVGTAVAVFVAGVLVITGQVVLRSLRRARLRNDLLGVKGVAAILGFVALVLAVSLPVSFVLDAEGVDYAALVGVSIGAVLMGVGGPVLTRYVRRLMLANRAGASR